MLAVALKGIQVVLLGFVSYLAYLAISPLVGQAAVEPVALPDASTPLVQDQSFARYRVIGERNLFKTRDLPLPIDPDLEKLEESQLELRLLGTTAAEREELSVATVEDTNRREVVSLRIGDSVAGAKVVGIERRRIVLENRGKREQISLDDSLARPQAPRAASRRARNRPKPAARSRRMPTAPAPGARPTAPSPAALTALFGGEELGLAAGETVSMVNGQSLADPAGLRRLFESLSRGGTATLTIVNEDGQTRQVVKELP